MNWIRTVTFCSFVVILCAYTAAENPNLFPFDTPKQVSYSSVQEWLQIREEIISKLSISPLHKSSILSNQGAYNSCATFGFTNAYAASVRYNIKLGGLQYDMSYNPMFIYRNTSGGNGGRSLLEVVSFVFKSGQASVDTVGKYPSLSGKDDRAIERRCCVINLHSAQEAAQCLRAGIGVYIGNSTAVAAGGALDTNKVRVAVLQGSWSHSTAFIGAYKINNTQYYLWQNSHGNRYTVQDAIGTDNDCCWFTEKTLSEMLETAGKYGGYYGVIPYSLCP